MYYFRRSSLFFVFCTLFFLSANSSSTTTSTQEVTKVRLKKTEFFVVDAKTQVSRPSTSINYKKENAYGWVLEFFSDKKRHVITEVIRLPAPANWGVGSNTVISLDRKSATTKYPISSGNSHFLFQQAWSYAPGDPAGLYIFDLYIDGVLVKSFKINVLGK